ncbi:MAG: peptidoglycan DD-metalloendopeptidase family protein [Candidatus Thiodiazotropha endolucinida]
MLLLSLLFSITACSSRGSAPVYNRSPTPPHRVESGLQQQHQSPSVRHKTSRTYYLVQGGDTLYSIAWRHYLSLNSLAAWNGIKGPDYAIYPGQRLRLKPPETSTRRVKRMPEVERSPAKAKRTTGIKPLPDKGSGVVTARTQTKPLQSKIVTKPVKPGPVNKRIKLSWTWPTKGKVVQTFSKSDQNRKGILIQGHMGQPIRAAEAGKVVYAGGGLVGYGNLVIIKHDQEFLSAYGYNRKLLVKEGDKLAKGDIVAHMGSPNRGGQPMLHFEVRKQGKPINPLPLLPRK